MLTEAINPDAAARYLSLSVFAQELLRDLGDRGHPERLRALVASTIAALDRIRKEPEPVDAKDSGSYEALPFQDYEQMSTLFYVISRGNPAQVGERILELRKRLMESVGTAPTADTIQHLTTLFRELASEALRRSRRPAERVSRKAIELCSPKAMTS